jgi:hypothetical protein
LSSSVWRFGGAHGLENEVDSFARRNGSSDVLTIPTENGPLRLRGLATFVTVRGGAYFFMPVGTQSAC